MCASSPDVFVVGVAIVVLLWCLFSDDYFFISSGSKQPQCILLLNNTQMHAQQPNFICPVQRISDIPHQRNMIETVRYSKCVDIFQSKPRIEIIWSKFHLFYIPIGHAFAYIHSYTSHNVFYPQIKRIQSTSDCEMQVFKWWLKHNVR